MEQSTTTRLPAGAALLHDVTFRRYWLARLLAQTAQAALLYGLLILIIDQTSRSIWPAVFVVCSIVPSLLFSLVGGWVADLLPQRALLVVLNLARAGLVGLLVRQGFTLQLLLGVTLGIWTIHQFFSPAESAIVARLVPGERLAGAAALASLALTLAQLLGMALLAPVLLKLHEPRVLFALCALLYTGGAVLLLGLGQLATTVPERAESERRRPKLALRHGWHVIVCDRLAFGAFLDAALIGIGLSTLVVIIPQFIERVLGIAADNTAYIFAPAAVGLVVGLQITPWLGRMVPLTWLATWGLLGFAVTLVAIGLIDPLAELLASTAVIDFGTDRLGLSPQLLLTMLLAIPAGLAAAIVNVSARTVLLQRAPPESRGQVFATQMLLGNLGALAPTLLAGALIDLIGVQAVALGIALSLVVGVLVGRRITSGSGALRGVPASIQR